MMRQASEEKKPDVFSLTQEQEHALNIMDNAVIVAGAGSGKTTVLAMRVVYLMLTHKVSLVQILVLTFTTKASAEMHQRIRRQIVQAIEKRCYRDKRLTQEEVDFLKKQLSSFIDAQISTIDSFCLRIANAAANRMGVTSEIQLYSDYHNELKDFIFRWIVKQKDKIPTLVALLNEMDIDRIINVYFLPLLSNFNAEEINSVFDCELIFRECREKILEKCNQLKQECMLLSKQFTQSFRTALYSFKDNDKVVLRIDAVFYIYNILLQDDISEEDIEKIVGKIKHINFKSPRFKSLVIQLGIKDSLKTFKKETLPEYLDLVCMLEKETSASPTYQLFYDTVKKLAQDWINYRKKNAMFSFGDIANIASKALQNYSDIQKWFAESYRFIIVDEAQDNSFKQKEFLYHLSVFTATQKQPLSDDNHNIQIEEKKFYFVGDPQQSIYSFRGAEVQSFTSMKDEMKSAIYLRHNHRSSTQLITFFNAMFTYLFNIDTLPAKTMFNSTPVSYQEQISLQKGSAVATDAPTLLSSHSSVEITLYQKEKDDDLSQKPIELEVYNTVRKIQALHDNDQCPYEDIAVLSRNKDIFEPLVKYFTLFNIPYSVNDIAQSLSTDVAYDFYVWLSLLLYPEDRSAYVAVLRSPLANISDSLVIDTLLEKKELFAVSNDVQEHPQFVNEVEHVHLLAEKYYEARTLVKKHVLTDVLDHFWFNCGYYYTILAYPLYHSFLDSYYVLRSFLQQEEAMNGLVYAHSSLRDAISSNTIQSSGTSLNKVSVRDAGVQAMTIHASKGLEFPIVFVVGLGRHIQPSKRQKQSSWNYRSIVSLPNHLQIGSEHSNDNYISSHVHLHKLLRERAEKREYADIMDTAMHLFEQEKQAGEALRVFYVALTRAKEQLFLSGQYSGIEDFLGDTTIKNDTFLDYVQAALISINAKQEKQVFSNTQPDRLESVTLPTMHMLVNSVKYSNIDTQASTLLENNQTATGLVENTIDRALEIGTVCTKEADITELITSKSPYYMPQKDYEKEFLLPMLVCESILQKYKIYSDFGTYCHALISEEIAKSYKIPEQHNRRLARTLSHLQEQEKELFITSAKNLVKDFLNSSFYMSVSSLAIRKTECPFLLWNEKYKRWLKGIIDFIVCDDTQLHLVDFKVDSYKYPQKHVAQISAYKLATQKLFPTIKSENIYCYVYYLRNAELVSITQEYDEDLLFTVQTDEET